MLENEDFTYTYSFVAQENETNKLDLYVKKISMKGDLVSFYPLTNQLTLCPLSLPESDGLKQFGQYFVKSCDIDPSTLLVHQEQFFYELFIKVADNQYLDVPVLITNGE